MTTALVEPSATFPAVDDWIYESVDRHGPDLSKLERYAAHYLATMSHDNFAKAWKQVDASVWNEGLQELIEEVVSDRILLKAVGAWLLENAILQKPIPGGPLEQALDQVIAVLSPMVANAWGTTAKFGELLGLEVVDE
jgi:hypothetical protein